MSQKKKIMIAMFLSTPNLKEKSRGGVETVCHLLLEGIISKDSSNDYFIIAFDHSNKQANGEIAQLAENIKIKFFKFHYNKKGMRRIIPNFIWHNLIIREQIASFKPQVFHAHVPSWLFLNHRNMRRILTLHSFQKFGRKPRGFWNDFVYEKVIQPIVIRNADIVTTVSREIESNIRKYADKEIRYIPNPLNEDFFDVKRDLDSIKKQQSLMLVGSIAPLKRMLDGLKIVEILQDKYPYVKLYIAGVYNERSKYYLRLKQFIKEHNLEKKVIFTGVLSIPEILGYYSKISVGLSLSENETFGLAPLEMMAAGLPVVATNVGVFKWHEDELRAKGAHIIKPGQIKAASEKICFHFEHPAQTINSELRCFIKDKFLLDRVIEKYLTLY